MRRVRRSRRHRGHSLRLSGSLAGAATADRGCRGRGCAGRGCRRGARCRAPVEEAYAEASTDARDTEADSGTAACAAAFHCTTTTTTTTTSSSAPDARQTGMHPTAEPGRLPGGGAQRQPAVRCRRRSLRVRHELLPAGLRLQRWCVRGLVLDLSVTADRAYSLSRAAAWSTVNISRFCSMVASTFRSSGVWSYARATV